MPQRAGRNGAGFAGSSRSNNDNDSNGGGGLSARLRALDRHTSVSREFQVRTSSGALFSVLTILSIAYLLRSEYAYNFQTTVVDHVHVNATSPAGLEVEFDITFPRISCALLSVDANDPTGQVQSLHLDRRHHVWKHRLDKSGRMIGRRSRFELGGTMQSEEHVRAAAERTGLKIIEGEELEAKKAMERMDKELEGQQGQDGDSSSSDDPEEEECGDCYGAGDEGECCPTCDDVKRAYQRKGWHVDIKGIKQCQFVKTSKQEAGEGCNVHGSIALSTGGGNLHIAPGHDLEKFGDRNREDMFTSLIDLMTESFETFDVSHTINMLRFGPEFPGAVNQLDGQDRPMVDPYAMHQYYVQVVPTEFRFINGTSIRSNQYSVTEHTRHVSPGSNRGLPGVFFFYEVSALHVELEEYREGWIRFLTSVCAIVGGVFTVGGMIDRFVYSKSFAGGGASGVGGPSGVLG